MENVLNETPHSRPRQHMFHQIHPLLSHAVVRLNFLSYVLIFRETISFTQGIHFVCNFIQEGPQSFPFQHAGVRIWAGGRSWGAIECEILWAKLTCQWAFLHTRTSVVAPVASRHFLPMDKFVSTVAHESARIMTKTKTTKYEVEILSAAFCEQMHQLY